VKATKFSTTVIAKPTIWADRFRRQPASHRIIAKTGARYEIV